MANKGWPDRALSIVCYTSIFPVLFFLALIARIWRSLRFAAMPDATLRLIWAGAPLYSLVASSAAMKDAEYPSLSVATDRYSTTSASDFDTVLKPRAKLPYGLNTIFRTLLASLFFIKIMFTRDVLHGFFNGGTLGKTPLIDAEYLLWKISGGKLVLMSYGSDSFVYSKLPDAPWSRALRKTYPLSAMGEKQIENRLHRFTKYADCVIGCIVHDYCLPRVDHICVLWYPAELNNTVSIPKCGDVLKVAHASNHDGIKGTAALEAAVNELAAEGVKIELDVIRRTARENVMERLREADIVVDQLLFGYALFALEAMSLGKPVISGISDAPMYQRFRMHSYLDDAPIISASKKTIKNILKGYAKKPERLRELGRASRSYVEKYHSPEGTVAIFEEIYSSF